MVGGDVTWTWLDNTGVHAGDLDLTAYSQVQSTDGAEMCCALYNICCGAEMCCTIDNIARNRDWKRIKFLRANMMTSRFILTAAGWRNVGSTARSSTLRNGSDGCIR